MNRKQNSTHSLDEIVNGKLTNAQLFLASLGKRLVDMHWYFASREAHVVSEVLR